MATCWPIGFGVIVTGLSKKVAQGEPGIMELRACAEGYTAHDGYSAEVSWEKSAEEPHIQLVFSDTTAIDRIIEDLNNLKATMEKGV